MISISCKRLAGSLGLKAFQSCLTLISYTVVDCFLTPYAIVFQKQIYQKWKPIFESEKNRQIEEPQFHLHSLGNASDPNVVLLCFGRLLRFQINLVSLRKFLCLVNLITLASSVMSFQAWIWVDAIKLETTKGEYERPGASPIHYDF